LCKEATRRWCRCCWRRALMSPLEADIMATP
jgi:hypothetical protein